MERVSLRQLIASGPARAAKVCLVSVGLVAALALSGCGAGSSAATVGGASVSESQVTEYIQQRGKPWAFPATKTGPTIFPTLALRQKACAAPSPPIFPSSSFLISR